MWATHLEKRIGSEERRPQVTRASELLGPALAPYAQTIMDWNGPESAFNGFLTSPAGALHSPDIDHTWFGLTIRDRMGFGFQRAWRYEETVLRIVAEYERFLAPGVYPEWVPIREPWRYVGEAGNPGYLNDWTRHPESPLKFRRNGDMTELTGMAVGTLWVGPIFTLPAGYIPHEPHEQIIAISGGTARVVVDTDGLVAFANFDPPPAGHAAVLGGVRFPAEQ